MFRASPVLASLLPLLLLASPASADVYRRATVFNTAKTANTNVTTSFVAGQPEGSGTPPVAQSVAVRVTIVLVSTNSVVNAQLSYNGGAAIAPDLNGGTAITAGVFHVETFAVPAGYTVNFQVETNTTVGLLIAEEVTGDVSLSRRSGVTDAELLAMAALATTDGNMIVGNGATWVAESGATLRTSIGVGTGDSPTFTGVTATGHVSAKSYAADAIPTVDASLDLDDGGVQKITLSAATEFTGPANATTGPRAMRLRITGDDADSCDLTFPAEWSWQGDMPASIAANAVAFLYLTVDGTAAGDVTACYTLLGSGS